MPCCTLAWLLGFPVAGLVCGQVVDNFSTQIIYIVAVRVIFAMMVSDTQIVKQRNILF